MDEFYLERVSEGQKGSIEFNGKTVEVEINKVIREIKSGRFIVELNFVKDENLELNQGLTFGVRINL